LGAVDLRAEACTQGISIVDSVRSVCRAASTRSSFDGTRTLMIKVRSLFPERMAM
jgi:hypothetical protein